MNQALSFDQSRTLDYDEHRVPSSTNISTEFYNSMNNCVQEDLMNELLYTDSLILEI